MDVDQIDVEEQITFSLHNFNNIQELIKFIDTKAGALLVVYGLVLSVFLKISETLTFINPFKLEDHLTILFSISTFLVGLILISILLKEIKILLIQIIKPRLAKNYSDDEYSLFYFEHIADMSKRNFFNRTKNIDTIQIREEILGQVYENSTIMKRKTKEIIKAIDGLYLSIILLVVYKMLSTFI